MSATVNARQQVTTRDRLVTTLFFALLIHGIILLGITFAPDDPAKGGGTTLEVTLVSSPPTEAPDKADYLAQVNQRGGGNTAENTPAEAPLIAPGALQNAGVSDARDFRSATPDSNSNHRPDTLDARDVPDMDPRQVLTQSRSDLHTPSHPTPPPATGDRQLLVARLITTGSDAVEPVAADEQLPKATSTDPHETFISVNTRESRFAEYLENWRDKVERTGNLNYPDQALREDMSGNLQLEVALNADGSIRALINRKSSGYPLLDQAAVRIVRLAAPFAPFPPEISRDTEVLRFVYEWRFINGRLDSTATRASSGTP